MCDGAFSAKGKTSEDDGAPVEVLLQYPRIASAERMMAFLLLFADWLFCRQRKGMSFVLLNQKITSGWWPDVHRWLDADSVSTKSGNAGSRTRRTKRSLSR